MKKSIVYCIIIVSAFAGCKRDPELVINNHQTSVSVAVTNLPPLPAGQGHYQLWATFVVFAKPSGANAPMHDSGFVSLGEFNVTANGVLIDPLDGSPARFAIPQGQDPQLIDHVILTIQGEDRGRNKIAHDEPGAAILGGMVTGTATLGIADLSVSSPEAFGTDFSAVTGKYTITAPTSPLDSNSGVWFYEPLPPDSVGLRNLAALPPEWTYEGWVVFDHGLAATPLHEVFYSTGKFRRADSADYDGAGPGRGPGTPLNFPGQDFIVGDSTHPATPNLRDSVYSFMVTIEPDPDNSPEPFFLTLLSSVQTGGPSKPAAIATSDMYNVIGSGLPTARVTITR